MHGRAAPSRKSTAIVGLLPTENGAKRYSVYHGGGDLEAHHLKSYAEYPELRYDVENGVTLCSYHHQYEVHDRG
jgi:hypothetical protein